MYYMKRNRSADAWKSLMIGSMGKDFAASLDISEGLTAFSAN